MGKGTKEKNKGIAGLLLLFGWLLFILLALLFYFYFKNDIPFLNKNGAGSSGSDSASGTYQSTYTYQTNANLDINALMTEYFAALSVCDKDKLQSLVTDVSKFDDMSDVERKANVVKQYTNINCYTLPGYTDDATIVYVTYNLSIADISCTPLDISCFYVVNTESGYKIDNGTPAAEITEYINKVQAGKDIQELYMAVRDNINECIEKEPKFAEFYETYIR